MTRHAGRVVGQLDGDERDGRRLWLWCGYLQTGGTWVYGDGDRRRRVSAHVEGAYGFVEDLVGTLVE